MLAAGAHFQAGKGHAQCDMRPLDCVHTFVARALVQVGCCLGLSACGWVGVELLDTESFEVLDADAGADMSTGASAGAVGGGGMETPGRAPCAADVCLTSCDPGFDDCDQDPENGCEASLLTDSAHCGACDDPCLNDHGSTSCQDSVCLPVCSAGFDDCDGSARNGCEASLDSIEHCGACGRACTGVGGAAVCAQGECQTQCDLTGTFALKLTVDGSWPQTSAIASGSGTFQFWMRAVATQSGTDVALSLSECGRFVPDFRAAPVSEVYSFGYADSLFDASVLPVTATRLSLSSPYLGADLTLLPSAVEMGVSLANPVTDAWPASASGLTSIDMDGDGKPGVRAVYRGDSGYSFPYTAMSFGAARADRAYVASRVAFSLSGTLSSCTQSTGSASFSHLDTRIFGCRRSAGGDCNGSEADFLDQNALDYTLGDASYTLEKITDSATCADVRAALP